MKSSVACDCKIYTFIFSLPFISFFCFFECVSIVLLLLNGLREWNSETNKQITKFNQWNTSSHKIKHIYVYVMINIWNLTRATSIVLFIRLMLIYTQCLQCKVFSKCSNIYIECSYGYQDNWNTCASSKFTSFLFVLILYIYLDWVRWLWNNRYTFTDNILNWNNYALVIVFHFVMILYVFG